MTEPTSMYDEAKPEFGSTDYIFGKDNSLVEEFVDLPGSLGPKAMSPLFFDGIPLPQMQESLGRSDLAGQRTFQQSRFWATPPRFQDDINSPADVMEVDLASAKPVNRITFDLAHFPQVTRLEFSRDGGVSWLPVRHTDGKPVVISIVDSNPPVIASQVARQGTGHPQHFGAGHWKQYDLDVRCLLPNGDLAEASALRLVLTRPFGGTPPVDALGNEIAYSLGVRNFTMGYRVEYRSDVPERPLREGSTTSHEAFAETRDILGSTLTYSLRETPAKNLALGGVWRSEPQPVNYAVVNLYVNFGPAPSALVPGLVLADGLVTSDSDDFQGEVIDRVYLDPLVSGCTVNMYVTMDNPDYASEDPWAYVRWTPINRDFKARKGIYKFNPVKAKHLKLEFTHLGATNYEANVTHVRTVKVFSQNIYLNYVTNRSGNTGGAGAVTNAALDPILRYKDRGVPPTITDTSRGYTPTEVFWSDDPNAAARLLNVSSTYNYQAWQGQMVAPRFTEVGNHNYVEIEVKHDRRVAYYAGLKNLEVFRVNYDATEDTDQYLDYFFDARNISTNVGKWIVDPEDLHTPAIGEIKEPVPPGTGEGAELVHSLLVDQEVDEGIEVEKPRTTYQVTSRVFKSKTNVLGVQFATTQTPAIDLLAAADSDFNSVLYPERRGALTPQEALTGAPRQPVFGGGAWEGVGDAPTEWTDAKGVKQYNPAADNRYNTDIGTTVRVRRNPAREDVERGGGIRNRILLKGTPGARVYAAARVISPVVQDTPIELNLVRIAANGDERVVASLPANVPANQVVEWFVDYTIGEGDQIYETLHYRDHEGEGETFSWDGKEQFAWSQMEFKTIPQPQDLKVELRQKGKISGDWYVDTLSVYEDPILWEFSNNGGATWWPAYATRNNPDGILMFPNDAEVAQIHTWNDLQGIYRNQDVDPNLPAWGEYTRGNTSWSDMQGTQFKRVPDRTRLRWRATTTHPGIHINALSIRPWYASQDGGIPSEEGVHVSGPGIASYDHYQPIHFDPRYRMWNKPVPQSWWFFYRQFLLLQHEDIPLELQPVPKLLHVPEIVFEGERPGPEDEEEGPVEELPPVDYYANQPDSCNFLFGNSSFIENHPPANEGADYFVDGIGGSGEVRIGFNRPPEAEGYSIGGTVYWRDLTNPASCTRSAGSFISGSAVNKTEQRIQPPNEPGNWTAVYAHFTTFRRVDGDTRFHILYAEGQEPPNLIREAGDLR